MSELRTVTAQFCEACYRGKGGECHTPGCVLYLSRAPDIPWGNRVDEYMRPASPVVSAPEPGAEFVRCADRIYEMFKVLTYFANKGKIPALDEQDAAAYDQSMASLSGSGKPEPDTSTHDERRDAKLAGYADTLASPAKAEAPSVERCWFREDAHQCVLRRGHQGECSICLHSTPAPAPSRAQGVDVEAVVKHMNALGWGKADQTCLARDLRSTFKALGISTAEGGTT